MTRLALIFVALLTGATASQAQSETRPIRVLFLGDNGHHRPVDRFRQIQPVLSQRGITLSYTDSVQGLTPQILEKYDALLIYANLTNLPPENEKALLEFVASGKGFVPIHCASYCFLNSPAYIDLVGAQFLRHGTGVFRTTKAPVDHPILKDFAGFSSWDETYVHTKHNEKARTVLEYREEGGTREPWTWVRTHGQGRVFYTAWGHDQRTWAHAGFQNLLERGIRWATGREPGAAGPYRDAPVMKPIGKDAAPLHYVEAKIPFYPPGRSAGGSSKAPKQMQQPLAPVDSMTHISHPQDLELRLFASEDMLGGKPLCMTWDERGRLWVAITRDYPNELQPEGKGRDRILIVEDANGDGKADKVTVFADKLSIPTSMVFAQGGLVVHQPPHTLFLKDTDGDGKADVRKILFTGWGTRDTHAGPSNLVYGFDNWLYGIVGYSGFDGVVGGQRHRFSQGFYRFRPDGSKMEFLRNTNNNSWGVGFSEEGILFGSTANGCPSVHLAIPNRYYEAVRGWSPGGPLQSIAVENRFQPITEKIRQVDWHGGFTAAAGHALYTARSYPREYWNRTAFVAEPTGHLAATFVLEPNGSDFRARYGWNLVAGDDEWVAPTMAEVGPDGSVWVIDWYAYIVQHNPTPPGWKTGAGNAYETELRDTKHGRIYRLVPRNASPHSQVTLRVDQPRSLVAALKSDNLFWRRHAQRLLVESRDQSVVPALFEALKDQGVDGIGLNPGVIHALWTLHGLGALENASPEAMALVSATLKHPSAGVRRNAVQVLPRTPEGTRLVASSGILSDGDIQVRLAALLALAEMPALPEVGRPLAQLQEQVENTSDRWIADALISASAAHDQAYLSAVLARPQAPSVAARRIVGLVAEHFARGGSEVTRSLLLSLQKAEPTTAEVVVAGLAKGWPRTKTLELSPEAETALTNLLPRLGAGAKGQLIRLATAWGSKKFEEQAKEAAKAMTALVADTKASDEDRIAAARQIVELRPDDSQTVIYLLDAITPRTSPVLTAGLFDALSSAQGSQFGAEVLKRFNAWSPTARASAIRLLLSRPDGTRVLLDALDKGQIPLGELALDQRQALSGNSDRNLARRAQAILNRGGALPNPDRQKVIDTVLPLLKREGDATAGKAIFTKHCATCHTHSGEGGKVGPDLTGTAVHTREHILTDILDPSRNVEGNFRVYNVETKDGRTLSGLLATETRTTVELVDAQAKRFTLLRENIESLVASSKSIMPEGFEKQVSEAELVNLMAFLTRRGRFLPLPLDRAATVVSTRGMFYSEEAGAERIIFNDWSPKTFQGVPFVLVDPQGGRSPNVILLHSNNGSIPPKMPRSVLVPCNAPAKIVHLLSGISGWGFPATEKGTVSLIVRLHYQDGSTEEHPLRNGEHFADYIRRVDVPGSQFAFAARGQQVRYLTVQPKRTESIKQIEFVKGPDASAPLVVAVTVESES